MATLVDRLTNVLSSIVSAIAKYVNLFYSYTKMSNLWNKALDFTVVTDIRLVFLICARKVRNVIVAA